MTARGEPERWIVVRNWERFQHYKDRRPPWIKVYTELLDDDAYLSLTEHQALVLHRLWLAYASTSSHLRLNTASLSRHLHVRVMTRDLEALNHAGFIEFIASNTLAPHARSRETEAEKEKTKAVNKLRTEGNGPGFLEHPEQPPTYKPRRIP